jgi:hypothetical protein
VGSTISLRSDFVCVSRLLKARGGLIGHDRENGPELVVVTGLCGPWWETVLIRSNRPEIMCSGRPRRIRPLAVVAVVEALRSLSPAEVLSAHRGAAAARRSSRPRRYWRRRRLVLRSQWCAIPDCASIFLCVETAAALRSVLRRSLPVRLAVARRSSNVAPFGHQLPL